MAEANLSVGARIPWSIQNHQHSGMENGGAMIGTHHNEAHVRIFGLRQRRRTVSTVSMPAIRREVGGRFYAPAFTSGPDIARDVLNVGFSAINRHTFFSSMSSRYLEAALGELHHQRQST